MPFPRGKCILMLIMLACSICSYKVQTVQAYSKHLALHRNTPGVTFKCLHPNCGLSFSAYLRYRQHIFRRHTRTLLRVNNKGAIHLLLCNVHECNFQTENRREFCTHLYNHIRQGVELLCPFCNIPSNVPKLKYRNANNLKQHLFRKHFNCNTNETSSPVLVSNGNRMPFNDLDLDDDISIQTEECNEDIEELSLKLLSSLYLALESKYCLPDKSLKILIEGISDVNNLNTKFILQQCANNGININASLIENNLFHKAHNAKTGKLRSKFCRNAYYKKYFNYVNPTRVDLGNNCKFYYIPIIETLSALFKDSDFYDLYFLNKSDTSDHTYFDIQDGMCFQNNTFFKSDPNAVQIILYQDAFEICNPLGAFRKKHKIVGIYMTFANLPPWHRSKVEQIQLVALVYEKDIKVFGFSEIMKVIINDIKKLESAVGVTINLGEKEINVRGSIAAVVGDNLGSHQIGGFNENFHTSSYFCRYCYINKAFTSHDMCTIKEFRTNQSHSFDVNMSVALNESCKGVKSESLLNTLSYYHTCNPGLPPCIAHDLFEGIVQYDVMLAINELVSKKILTYDFINLKLKNLTFVSGEKFFLPLIRKSEKLPGTATQNLWILILLPFAIKEKGNDLFTDPAWNFLLILRNIVNILLSFKVSIGQLGLLKYLISEYMENRQMLFPNDFLKPKHHFLLHYPYLTRQFGPLRHLWTLRFESKHQYFKNIIRHTNNYKNVLLSLTHKHQLLQALHSTQKTLYTKFVLSDDADVFSKKNYPADISNVINKKFKGAECFISPKATFRGITYSRHELVSHKKNDFGDFVLCRIVHILINKAFDNLTFFGKRITVRYNSDLGLYFNMNTSSEDDVYEIVDFEQLINYETVLEQRGCDGQSYYYFKSAPFEIL